MLMVFGVISFLVAWVANGFVGLLSGERPRDTERLWLDTFLGMFAILELGMIGRFLNYLGFQGWPRKAVLFIGLLCAVLFLLKAGHHEHGDNIQAYPAQTFLPVAPLESPAPPK